MLRPRWSHLFLALAPLLAAACANMGSSSREPAASASTGQAQTSASAKVTDPQIAAIVVAANQVDIEAGKQAMSKSTNEEVKRFAQRMVTDHSSVNQAAVDLVTRLGVTPEETETSKGLIASGKQTRERLAGLSGAEYDRAYADHEVAYHELVLKVIDSTLVPNAQNAELKSMLVGVRPAFVQHLEHARAIQKAVASGQTSSVHHH